MARSRTCSGWGGAEAGALAAPSSSALCCYTHSARHTALPRKQQSFANGSHFALEHLCKAQWKVPYEGAARVHHMSNGTWTLCWEGKGSDSVRVPTQGCIPPPVIEARQTTQRELRDVQVRRTPAWGDIRLRTVSPTAGGEDVNSTHC